MTDPDDRRNSSSSRSRSTTPPVASMPQPIFLADRIHVDSEAPRLPRLHLPPSVCGVSATMPENSISLNDPEDPFGFHDGPRHNLASQRLAENYEANHIMIPPEVQLPANWDAPLQNPIPVVPPMPTLHRRGRGRPPRGPLHDISGPQCDPALSGLHRGHIAHREQVANHRAAVENLLRQRQEQHEQQIRVEREQLEDLQRQAEQRQRDHDLLMEARAAILRVQERQRREAQRAIDEEEERHILEEYHREVNRARRREELEAHTSTGCGSGGRNNQENRQILEEEERQNLETYQREAAAELMHQQAHSSRSSQRANNNQQRSEAEAAADYERNRHHENLVRRQEEARQQREQGVTNRQRDRNHNNANPNPQQAMPKGRRPYHEPQHGPERHYLGPMNVKCNHCNALHFESEKLSTSTRANKKFGSCCLQGQIRLPVFMEPPRTLREMLCGISPLSSSFKKNIRQYNAAFAFVSLGVKVDLAITNAPGPYCFRINGELHHLSGSLLPENGENESYAQIYIHDPAVQLDMRNRLNQNLDPIIMSNLQAMLNETHPYAQLYKQAYHIMRERPPAEQRDVAVRLRANRHQDLRRYNLPNANEEVAAIIPGDGSEERSDHRDIVLHLRGGALKRISHLHPSYASLHYVLLFPYGEDGWHPDIPAHLGPEGQQRSAKVSQRAFYAHRLHARPGIQPALFWGGKLFQQYVVDAWASVEQNMLNYVRFHQKELRADVYQGLRDAAMGDRDENFNLAQHGQRLILPSTHVGSERNMLQLYQDSMAICRAFRKPDIFLTMTANPNWPEIQEALLKEPTVDGEKQTAVDRPDIVARVFEEKKKALLKEIKDGLFGKTAAMVHTIEFQKRGLPHMHLLIFLEPEYKIRTAADVDSIVSAQIPDPAAHPVLYNIVTQNMVHGPCGTAKPDAKCMVDGHCSKRYRKEFCENTQFGDDGYPKYARPNNGRSFVKNGFEYDNRDVVPYNAYLSAKYNCHINVEICAAVEAVKYIHKYIYKGHDRTTLEISGDQQRDEIKEYLDARYISAAESCWHIFEFSMHSESPSVYRLPVHLEDQQLVYYNADDDVDEVLGRGALKKTPLTEWFKANETYPDARNTAYQDFPKKWVYVKEAKKWKPRERGPPAIGRMYFASPSQGERFYLRMLLTTVTGATSFANLRTVNNVQYGTFKEACHALGLLENDNEWIQCLTEAGEIQTGSSLRSLFAIILLSCHPTSPDALWHQFKHKICDDLRRNLERVPRYFSQDFTDDQIYDYGLHLLDKILLESGKRLSDFPPMPLSTGPQEGEVWETIPVNFLLAQQLQYNIDELKTTVERNCERFNAEQRNVFDAAMDSVNNNKGKMLFIHSAGGCGKTFVCNTIAAAVRAKAKVALCVASSGIAALLLDGGQTAHSRLGIPPETLTDTTVARVKRNSDMHKVLLETKLIIWDEVPMQHKYAADAVDRNLRDLLGINVPFGGITVVFGGDFRQTLPVIQRAVRQQIVASTLCRGKLWKDIEVHYLLTNMRLERTPESISHAKWLLDIGAGNNIDASETIQLPEDMCLNDKTIESLIDHVYPGIEYGDKSAEYFLDRTILACRNDEVDDINEVVLAKFPGNACTLLSADSVQTQDGAVNDYQPYPVEYLNSLRASGLPLAKLTLKPGCPIMLLRNLDPSKGLCNGTRMILNQIRPRVLDCTVISGDRRFSGNRVLIPRITLTPSNETLPIPLRRRQFPVRLAFAMTINKSQGQSVKHVGLDLRSAVFSHGQLYVALSRCTSANRIKILLPENCENRRTPNIVYKEVLNGLRLTCEYAVIY